MSLFSEAMSNPAWSGSSSDDRPPGFNSNRDRERGRADYEQQLSQRDKNQPLTMNPQGVLETGNQLGPQMASSAPGTFERAGQDLRDWRMANLGSERERLMAEYESAPRGLQQVAGAPEGYRQSSAGTIVPGAPEFNSLFSVSEADAMAEASPRLKALKRERELNEPRVGRAGWLPWAGRGFGLGKRGGEAAKEAVAEYGVGMESRRGAIVASATRDILERRQTRERYRQDLYNQAMGEEAEAESARRFYLQLELDRVSDEESRIHARNMQEEDQEFQREQLKDEVGREYQRDRRAEEAEDAGRWWTNDYVNRGSVEGGRL